MALAQRRASAGAVDDYPEHLNPFREVDDEEPQLRRSGTLGRLRRRASLASTWSLQILRRSAPPPPAAQASPPPQPSPSPGLRRHRFRDSLRLPWITPRRPRAVSAPPLPSPHIKTPPASPVSPATPTSPGAVSWKQEFVLTPRTHRYRSSPPTPPEERARKEAQRLYGPSRGPPEEDPLPEGPLAPLRIEEDPEQRRRAAKALEALQALEKSEGKGRPPKAPARKRRAPPPPVPSPATASPIAAPTAPDDDDVDEGEGERPHAEDSSPEADQGEGADPLPVEGLHSPRVPPRKPRRASAPQTPPPSPPPPITA